MGKIRDFVENVREALDEAIVTESELSAAVSASAATKVDIVPGKELSDNNFTDDYINKIENNLMNYVLKNVNYTAVPKDFIVYDLSGLIATTLTLPTAPVQLSKIKILDSTGSFGVNPLSVTKGVSDTIMGFNDTVQLDVANKEYTFLYIGTDWRIF